MASQSENSHELIRPESASVDRISDFPLHLLDRIFSFLEMRELMRIRILSRRWSNMEITRMTLIFDRFSNVSTFPHWINAALRQAKEFCLSYTGEEEDLTLPDHLVTARCFKKLDLWLAFRSLILPKFDQFCWLTHLRLKDVHFPDEDLTNNFFSRCHVLEYLTIDTCEFSHGSAFCVISPHLKNLTITHKTLYRIRIYDIVDDEILDIPPNQISMNYYGFVVKDYSLEKLSSLVDISMFPFLEVDEEHESIGHVFLKFLQVLQRTSVLELHITAQRALCNVFNDVERSWISFPMLKKLKFELGNDKRFLKLLSHLLRISPNLETLTLAIDKKEWGEGFHFIYVSTPVLEFRIKEVELSNFEGRRSEMEIIRCILERGRALEKMIIKFEEDTRINRDWITQAIRNMQKASSRVVLTII